MAAHFHLGHYRTPGYVYAVRSTRTGLVKIGWSGVPEQRISDLAGSGGEAAPLDVLMIVAGTPRLEREFHEWFAADRVTGEWFTATEALLAFIGALDSLVEPMTFTPCFRRGGPARPSRLVRRAL